MIEIALGDFCVNHRDLMERAQAPPLPGLSAGARCDPRHAIN
jgi:hypothetical protein